MESAKKGPSTGSQASQDLYFDDEYDYDSLVIVLLDYVSILDYVSFLGVLH